MLRSLFQLLLSLLSKAKTERPPAELTFPEAVVARMERHGYTIFRGEGELNIVYIHDCDIDGFRNSDLPEVDSFNDACIVIRFDNKRPVIVGAWRATVDPGVYYRDHPIVSGGTAFIKWGQYTAWQTGMHRGDHEALLQTGGTVTVVRDKNKSLRRDEGDWEQTGYFGINQHGPSSRVSGIVTKVGPYSAGCLVRRSMAEHREFMACIKQDPRYLKDRNFIFTSTILEDY